ncbi:hypothetical protein Bbelb_069290 [Branchiostoma belcheri]|nr:hypothetical protein Bbelb_069290 [Branchiostoma belcheri]
MSDDSDHCQLRPTPRSTRSNSQVNSVQLPGQLGPTPRSTRPNSLVNSVQLPDLNHNELVMKPQLSMVSSLSRLGRGLFGAAGALHRPTQLGSSISDLLHAMLHVHSSSADETMETSAMTE